MLTVKDLYKKSIPRNPLLFGLMQRVELAEKAGSGLVRMDNAMKNYNLPKPVIEADKNWFSITFARPDLQGGRKGGQISSRKGGQISERQKQLLHAIAGNPFISRRELSAIMNIQPSAVQKHLEKLKKLGILKRVGPDRGGHWELIE